MTYFIDSLDNLLMRSPVIKIPR